MPAVVVARTPAPQPKGEPSRTLMMALMVVAPLVIMGGGVLLVGRLLRPTPLADTPSPTPTPSARETPRVSVASETPAPPTARPVPVSEEVVTVAQLGDAPSPPLNRPSPAVTPRPARPVTPPSARPSEPNPEQLRAQQLATLLGQADAALANGHYEDASRGFDEALKLDAANARAAAGRTRAQWAASAPRRGFVLGKTVNAPVKAGKGPAGFDSEDVEVKAQDFLCDVSIEMQPAVVRPGGSLDYRAAVSVASIGKKAINVKSVQVNVQSSGARTSETLAPLVRSIAAKQRAVLAEAKGAWVEGMTSWGLEIVVTGEKGDVCRNSISWR